jgi:hypothetical protein
LQGPPYNQRCVAGRLASAVARRSFSTRHNVQRPMEDETKTVRAETLAIQAVLTNVLFQLKRLDPVLAEAIARGFDDAADQIESHATPGGRALPLEPVVRALAIIEDLRTASLGRNDDQHRTA